MKRVATVMSVFCTKLKPAKLDSMASKEVSTRQQATAHSQLKRNATMLALALIVAISPSGIAHSGLIHHKVRINNTTGVNCDVILYYGAGLDTINQKEHSISTNSHYVFDLGSRCSVGIAGSCENKNLSKYITPRCITGQEKDIYKCVIRCKSSEWNIYKDDSDGKYHVQEK